MIGIRREVDMKDVELFDLFLFSPKWELIKYLRNNVAIFEKIRN